MEQFKLGTRELLAIILITIGTKFTDFTPDLLFPKTFMATWMIPLISAAIFMIPLLLLIKLITKYEIGLVEIIQKLLGKYLGTFICIFIFLFSLAGTAFLLKNYSHILVTLYFPKTPIIVFQVLAALVCLLIASGGAYMIGRTSWITLPYIKFALALLLILALTMELDAAYLFPFLGTGISSIIKESFFYNSIYVEVMLLACLIPYVKKVKQYSKAAIIGLTVVAVEMTLFFIFYIIMFDAYSLEYISLPFQTLTRSVNLGRFISNFEGYFLAFWLLSSILKYATYLYITTLLFTQTFQIKSTKFHLIPITLLVVLIGVFPENAMKSSFIYRDFILNIGSVFFIVLPFILWAFSKRKKVSTPS